MKQNSQSHFPVRTAPGLRIRIVAIIVAIAVIVFLAGCVGSCPPGVADASGVNILLLAETSQLVKIFPGTAPDAPQPLSPGNSDILINTTSARQHFNAFFETPFPYCGRERYDNAEILRQFDRIQNKGDTPIYSLIVQDYRRAFAQLQEDFPNYERLTTAYTHGFRYRELFISDGTGPIDPTTAPRWANKKNFIDRFIEDICNGNASTCEYMTVIEPGRTGHIVNTSFVRDRSLDVR